MKHLKTIKAKKSKGQTALEYAMVTVAISLVLLGAWNVVGDRVKGIIQGQMLQGITNQLTKGNNAVSR
jgi:Flp pilus assembly pilin Flp